MKMVDIAEQLGCEPATIRTWKNRYKWDSDGSATFQKKSETKRNVSKRKETPVDDGTRETLQNDELTPDQQMFCIYYSRTFNAAQSYQKAYGCKYESAMVRGSELLRNVKVRKEIERLKEIKRQQIVTGTEDIVELQMRIAFADIGNYMSFGQKEITDSDTEETFMVSTVDLKESGNTDTQLIQEVRRGKDGVSVKLADKQKAIDWLTRFFEMNPSDRHRKEFDKRKLDLELLKLEMQTKESADDTPEQDNFLDALNVAAQEVWSDD
nr:MAG TPA: Terminase small subunit [Caudoviricetes sp.]